MAKPGKTHGDGDGSSGALMLLGIGGSDVVAVRAVFDALNAELAPSHWPFAPSSCWQAQTLCGGSGHGGKFVPPPWPLAVLDVGGEHNAAVRRWMLEHGALLVRVVRSDSEAREGSDAQATWHQIVVLPRDADLASVGNKSPLRRQVRRMIKRFDIKTSPR